MSRNTAPRIHQSSKGGERKPAGAFGFQPAFPRVLGVLGVLGALALLPVWCGCQSSRTAFAPERPENHSAVALSAGDTIRLSFPGAPEFNQIQKVRADGKISLPMIGEVTAAGKQFAQFQSELAARYGSQLRNTEVVVSLESSSSPVLVSGAVNKPGRINLDRPLTVFEAVMEAGGVAAVGNPKKVHLVRVNNGQHLTRVFDLKPVLGGKPGPVFYVRGGDVIFVEESFF